MPKKPRSAQLALIPGETYCCDADSLINLKMAGLFKRLRWLVRERRIKVPKGIHKELTERSDIGRQLSEWDRNYEIVVDLDTQPGALRELAGIERQYGVPFKIGNVPYEGFYKGGRNPKSKDGQVVALAKARKWAAVSDDGSVQGACYLEGVQCLHWEELARRL